jgi:hypothetical protein
MLLASCTHKFSFLTRIQAEKQLVIQCCKRYEVREISAEQQFCTFTPTLIYREPNKLAGAVTSDRLCQCCCNIPYVFSVKLYLIFQSADSYCEKKVLHHHAKFSQESF